MGEIVHIPLQRRGIWLVSLMIVVTLIIASTPLMAPDSGGSPHSSNVAPYDVGANTRVDANTPHQSVSGFTENLGQIRGGKVRFYATSTSGSVSMLPNGITFTLTEPPTETAQGPDSTPDPAPRTTPSSSLPRAPSTTTFLRLTFGGSNPSKPVGMDPMPGRSNYFIGSDLAGWATGVRTFREVVYRDLWDGVDLCYRVVDGNLKYDLVVRPGTDPDVIRFCVEGHEGLDLDPDGALTITTQSNVLREDPPISFLRDDPSVLVDSEFVVLNEGSYGFALGRYDPTATIVIDPLVSSTFLGGSDYESGQSVAIDDEGNVLVTGYTRSLDFPSTDGANQTNLTGGSCAYVSKLDAECSEMLFSTYFGGTDWDFGADVAVDDAGNVYLAGVTFSGDIPVTTGAFQGSLKGSSDVFICKLNDTGSSLVYATYLGGSGKDYASYLFTVRIQVDPLGALYIASSTDSDDFPTTAGAFQTTRVGSEDAYVCKLSASGGSLDYCTLLGGSGNDFCFDLAASEDGVVYICGQTASHDLPATSGSYQESHTGDFTDIFVGAIASDGGSLEYLTYVGNWSSEEAWSIALDGEGAAYVHGSSSGPNFPTTSGVFQESVASGTHPVVFKLDPEGEALEYSTYLGGTVHDEGGAITVDGEGNAFLAGRTGSSDFPTTDGCFQNIFKGSYDSYVAVLSSEGSDLLMSTYVGMTSLDAAMDVAFDGNASLYVVGITTSDNFPTTSGAYQRTYGGGSCDAFLLRFILDIRSPLADAGPDIVIDQHETVTFNASRSGDNLGIIDYSWTFVYDGTPVILGGVKPTFTFHTAGSYTVNLTVRDLAGNLAWDIINVTVRDITIPFADAGDNITIQQYQTVLFDGSGSYDNVGIAQWRWAFTYLGMEVNLLGTAPTFTFQEAGVFEVALNISDAVGNWAVDLVTVIVIDVTAPTADAGRDLNVDQHETVEFDGRGSHDNVGVMEWTWTFNDGGKNVTLNGSIPTYVFDVPGVYTVLLTVRDAEGNSGTDTVVIEVRDIERPVVNAGEDVIIDQDRTIVFNGSSSSDNVGIRSFEWTFEYDDMTVRLEGPTPNFFFHTAGMYTVMLIVTDEEGNWASDFVSVTVVDSTRPIADAGPDVRADQHQMVTLDGSGSWDNSVVARWRWVFFYRGSTFSLEGERPTFIFDEAGDYEVNLTVLDPSGNSDNDTMTVTIIDVTAPVAVLGDDVGVSQGTIVELNGSRSTDNVGIEEWMWSLTYDGAIEKITGETQSFLFTIPGTYVVTLEVSDAVLNSASATFIVTVLDTTPPVAVTPSDMTVEIDEEVTFDGSSSTDNVGIEEWSWTIKFEGHSYTEVLEGPMVDYSFDQPGQHRVTLTVTDAQGNSDSMTFTVSVEGMGSPWWIIIIVIVGVFVFVAIYLQRRQRGQDEPTSQ